MEKSSVVPRKAAQVEWFMLAGYPWTNLL